MEHLGNKTTIEHACGLTETLDVYLARLSSVACVTIVDELVRSLAHFYDLAAASDDLEGFRASCQSHPLHRLLLEDPFTARAFSKPRGYTPDPVMLDYIHRPRRLSLSEVGEAVHFVTTSAGAARNITARRDYLAKAIAQTVRCTRKARILSVANGHLRELDAVKQMVDRRDFQIVALDHDCASLQEAVNANPDFNIVPVVRPVAQLLHGQHLAKYDLIYSASLFDGLPSGPALSLLNRLADRLTPAARLVVANHAPGAYWRGYVDGMMGWSVHYRSEAELERLADMSKLARYKTYRDAPRSLVYLEGAPPGLESSE